MLTIRTRLAPAILMGMLTLPAVLTAQTEERSQTQGIKETEKFVKAGRATTQAVEEGKLQAQKTLEAYNTLVTQPSKDMKGDYKRVLKGTEAMNDKVAKAREKVEAEIAYLAIAVEKTPSRTFRTPPCTSRHRSASRGIRSNSRAYWRRCKKEARRWSRSGNSWPTRSPTWAAT